jgi:hypothetical protein
MQDQSQSLPCYRNGGGISKRFRVHNFYNKNNKGNEASVAMLLGNCFIKNMLGTDEGHNDRLLQPTYRFSIAAIFNLGGKKKVS